MRLLLARCVELGARLAEPGEFTQARVPQRQARSRAGGKRGRPDRGRDRHCGARGGAQPVRRVLARSACVASTRLIELRALHGSDARFSGRGHRFLLREGDVARSARVAFGDGLSECWRALARARCCAKDSTVVLVGAPNVGKSSLLNRLVGEDAAIVAAIPGHDARHRRATGRDRRHSADDRRHGRSAGHGRCGRAPRHRSARAPRLRAPTWRW